MKEVDDILAHHGVKGMKWGIRRRSSQPTVSKSKKGSENHASEDAKRANQSHGTAKTHGTAALSNKELQDLVNRMNLEQQYSRLSTTQRSAGAKFAQDILVGIAKQQVAGLANQVVAKQVAKAIR